MKELKCEVHHESAGGRVCGMYAGNDIQLAKRIYDFLVKETNASVARFTNYVIDEERLESDVKHD